MNSLNLYLMEIAIQTFRDKHITYANMLMSCKTTRLSEFEMQFDTAIAVFRGDESDENIVQRF